MKRILLVLFAIASVKNLVAQTPVNKIIPYKPGQSIDLHFDYPNLVRFSTWDKNEISIQGTVSINSGEHDDAFEIESNASGERISISNHIRDMKSLPRRYTINQNGKKTTFRTRADLERYQKENGDGYNSISEGLDMEITLDIKIPKGAKTNVMAVYGMVEVKDYTGPLSVDATYGGVDAAFAERNVGELSASTNFGEIYTNFRTKFGSGNLREENFHTFVSAKPGTGPAYKFESKYGNVYLRTAD